MAVYHFLTAFKMYYIIFYMRFVKKKFIVCFYFKVTQKITKLNRYSHYFKLMCVPIIIRNTDCC